MLPVATLRLKGLIVRTPAPHPSDRICRILKSEPHNARGRTALIPLESLLRYAVEHSASDIHLKVGSPPVVRIDGTLVCVPGTPKLTPAELEKVAMDLTEHVPVRRDELRDKGETDLAFPFRGVGRFRVNIFRQRGSASVVMRLVPNKIPALESLGLPPVVKSLAEEERGIVLVTGTTGSGKSTTMASMIDHLNRNHSRHVLTIEDPIEFLHSDRRSIINQREIGNDTDDFSTALRRLLRQDPDVIMIGEIRDAETIETALNAAETGHMVISTLHTLNATETINRIIGLFPPHLQQQVRAMLASTLRGVISQRLVPRIDGTGRLAAVEVLVMTGRARDMILDPAETSRIHEVIREGEYDGMQSYDQSLYNLVMKGLVSVDEAMRAATSKHDFKLMLDAKAPRRDTAQYDAPAPAAEPFPPNFAAMVAPGSGVVQTTG